MSRAQTSTPTSDPVPPQKRLIIVLDVSMLRTEHPLGMSVWFWNTPDSKAWLDVRKPLFPQASGQELVSLAILPEDQRDLLVAKLSGVRLDSGLADPQLLGSPNFSVLSATCAICSIGAIAIGAGSRAKNLANQAIKIFDTHIEQALPGAMKSLDCMATPLNLDALEELLLSSWEQRQVDDTTQPAKPAVRRSRL